MPYALAVDDGELLVGMADGRILAGRDAGDGLEETGVRLEGVTAMAAA
jgi:hypothetical protein